MKKSTLSLRGWLCAVAFVFTAAFSFAQTPQLTKDQWENAKAQNLLDGKAPATYARIDSTPFAARIAPNVPVQPASTSCSCWQTRDLTFSVAPFQFAAAPDYRNDDGSTPVIALPFNFCLYGTSFNSVYINNNGNVSFGAPYGTFTAAGFPNAAFQMVAPFWADVDTRNAASGLVYYKITPTYMIVQWDGVGYYNSHVTLINTFQLIITDGNDPLVPNGNVSFCYRDMQWTTGDASSGVGGFGGFDAIVGANKGDGINYIQFGAFNQPGNTYNGPANGGSGIDWLDNQSFTFDACTNNNNIPPTLAGLNPCDTLRICEGDTIQLNPQFFSPEVGQTTTITTSTGNGYTVVSNTPGNTAQLTSYFVGQSNNLGYNTVTITAVDNGTPNATSIITIVVLVTASPTSTISSTNATCSTNNGSATVVASGGSGSYTYTWSPSGGSAPSATNLGPGTYTCVITDAVSGCTSTETAIIGTGTPVSLTNSSSNISCNGGSDGSATVNATGGSGIYTYAWAPSGGTAPTASGLSVGSYTVTVTDSDGCTSSQAFNITQPAALTATATQTDVTCNGAATGNATVVASGGTPNYSYAWTPTGGSAATATGLTAGTYTCTITDLNGCATTQQFTITEPPVLACSISLVPTICNGSSATANPTGGVGPYSYAWSNFTFSPTANNLNPGNYSVTITDANGCTTTQSVTVTTAPLLTSIGSWNSVFCFGDSTGSATVNAAGGTPGYSYAWAPSGGTAATATGLIAGNYTCTITDANGCILTRSFTLTEPPQVISTSTQTNNTCFGGATGTATVSSSGGVPNYTYSWAPTGGTNATATGLAAGTYTCTITDANGCNSTVSVTITEPTAVTASVSVVNATCVNLGSATATPSGGTGPYTYLWSPSGGTSATENNLNAGTYTVTITDANGCATTQTATITMASNVNATATSTDVTCFGSSTGTASVSPTGGTAPYTYSWSPTGGTNATATGLAAGTYTVTVTDANGCQTTQTVTITAPSQLTTSSVVTNISCNGQSSGSATVTPSGGIPGYTYSWAPTGGTNQTANGLSVGTYTCTVTDANGCSRTQTVTITQPAVLAVAMTNLTVCPGDSALLTSNVTGGVSPYSYAWSNGPTTSSQLTPVSTPTTFTVVVTDANGCTTSGTTSVTLNPVPVATITSTAVNGVYVLSPLTQLCFTGSSSGIVAWDWNLGSSGTSNVANPCVTVTAADTGIYCAELSVTNAQGCSNYEQLCVEITDVYYNIPNVFSPNGDGTNDAFIITNNGMKTFHCEIYDRWGALVYEWESTTGYWDGKTSNGNDAVDGVYYWTLNMQDFAGKAYENHGFVHLIRGK
jgi:gliding motility-associated-like protein